MNLCGHQVVDTPGFGDSDDEMEALMEEMMDVLNDKIGEADVILLLIKGTSTRFSAGLQIMLKRMSAIFGSKWWDNVVIGASFWNYDEWSIDRRKCYPKHQHRCRDEEWFKAEITQQIQSKFNVQRSFPFIFADSWSQAAGPPGFNKKDELQQQHWLEETDKLWHAAKHRQQPFQFKTINDILEENVRQKRAIEGLNEVIEKSIADLRTDLTRFFFVFFIPQKVSIMLMMVSLSLGNTMRADQATLRTDLTRFFSFSLFHKKSFSC